MFVTTSRKLAVLIWFFRFFAAARANHCTDLGQIWHVPLTPAKLHPNRSIFGDFRPENPPKSLIFATFFTPHGRFCQPIFLKVAGFTCSYSPHTRLKFAEIHFINQRFITEKPRVGHFSPKHFVYGKNDAYVLYPYAKFGGDRFTHGDARTKVSECLFLFLFVTLGVAYFGIADLPRCSAL